MSCHKLIGLLLERRCSPRKRSLTRQRDALSAERRKLPMVKVEKAYVFDGPNGATNLRDLFDGRRQLVIYHFMFDPSWDEGCAAALLKAGKIWFPKGELPGLQRVPSRWR